MYKKVIKPIGDFVLAICILTLSFPLLFFIIICLLIVNNGKPFFFQSRPGKKGKLFNIIKLKTMNDRKDNKGVFLPDADRLTNIGKFIRKTSFDEIPQLFNVLKGDMSIIGPRPLLPEYLSLYSEEQAKRHDVKPGITGWAQVNGRNAISWEKKFTFDVWYVNHISFFLDLKIFFLTLRKVIKSENINTEGVATTTPFKGTIRK